MKIALITGVTGQDGSYLAELLLEKGYFVHALKRRSSSFNTDRVNHIYENPNFKMHYADLSDTASLINIINEIKPDEIYNLAAQSHVKVSFDIPEYSADIDAIGVLRLLEAIRICGLTNKTKFYQASSSEMFGKVIEIPQKETTPFYPRSPYGVAKVFGYWITKNYRESYNIFACNGILFNHESPRRGETFVTRKITRTVARIKYNLEKELVLGNLDAKRDWGHARDYVKAMWLMLQQDIADDYVVATGEQYTVREFVEKAFKYISVNIIWKGEGVNEIGIDENTGKILVKVDEKYFRPAEVETLLGDATKAKEILKWIPETPFENLISEMMDTDLEIAKKEKHLLDNGFKK